jgi:ribosomal protein L16 Arg81 hydroxylase
MRVWPFEEFRDYAPPDAIREQALVHGARIEEHQDRSILLEGEPGDILYWPSTYWHVGESDGSLHASFTISLHFPWRPLSLIEVMVRQRTEASLGGETWREMYPFDGDAPQRSAKELPSAISSALAQFRAVANDESLERSLTASWINRVSAYGFTTVPAPAPRAELDDDMRLVACPHSPLVWQEAGEVVLFSANGHAVAVPRDPDVLRLLERVSAESSFSAASLLASLRAEGGFALEGDHVRQILATLVSLRALRVE